MTTARKYRLYCSVYGCLNSSIKHPELAFFKLPTQPERLSVWLSLMCREDLASKANSNAYRVCEQHFIQKDILPTTKRKLLKKTATPSLKLPGSQRSDRGGSPEEFKPSTIVELIESSTQTETVADDSSAQPTTSSYSNISCRIQFEHELESNENGSHETHSTFHKLCDKFLSKELDHPVQTQNFIELQGQGKINESENETQETQESTFHKHCDKFLSKELALLVKTQNFIKLQGMGKENYKDYIIFCFNLYITSPQAYRLLQSALCLPSTKTLYKHFPISSEINEITMGILKIKVSQMTEAEKNCSVMVGTMKLKTSLFYNIKEDKIIGFHDIEGWQSPEPAKDAIVIMVRGIFSNWNLPVAYALLSESKNDYDINKWFDNVLEKLFEIGLNIRTFVSGQECDFLNAIKKISISVEKPYFIHNNRKIHYIFDARYLIKNVRDNLMRYDFHFGDSVAKYEHIVQFYDQDRKKSFRLAHKLTNSHINPTNLERRKLSYATQLLSKSVAAGISTYVDFNAIDESGRHTANFIAKMNDLFDSCTLKQDYENKKAYTGIESQKAFFREMLISFQSLKLINPEDGRDCTSNVTFIEKFQITISSLLLLFDDLQLEGHTLLYTRTFNRNALESLFKRIQTKNGTATKPTSKQFVFALKKNIFSNIMKPTKGGNCTNDVEKLLQTIQTTQEESAIPTEVVGETSNTDCGILGSSSVKIACSEYNQLDMPEKDSLFYICGFLLKNCGEKHNDCGILKLYMKPYQRSYSFSTRSCYLRYRDYRKNNSQTLMSVPRDDFVEYVEKMEEVFQNYFKLELMNCKLTEFIYKQIKDITFTKPCFCFPKTYLIKLFIRLRIFYTIKFNNRAFRTSSKKYKYLSVHSL